jgi:putative radical SAM enzyme (TIGR03279 family)
MVRVKSVSPESIAAELDVTPGTEIVSVNGRTVDDFLDWEFMTADDQIEVVVRTPDGEELLLDIERVDGEPLGIELEPPTVRRCANRCEFCFIEGLPQGLRKALYIRDDDYRLSFAYGNFATLSNLKERDFERILEYRLSPLYVSVHATPWEARKVLLNNPRVPNIVAQLTRLAKGGIQFHGQMVIVPGLNDGEVLEESLRDLYGLGAACLSVAIVPVGLTQFSHLYTGTSMTPSHARGLLDTAARWAERSLAERGARWVFGSDELYILADEDLPDAEAYEDFPQVENGVGAVAALRRRVIDGLSGVANLSEARVGVVTGVAMAPLLPPLLERLAGVTHATFEVMPVVNSLFGPTTTTAGLLVGADITAALADRSDLDLALIPAETINDHGVFLDDVSLDQVRHGLPIPVVASYDFVDVLGSGGAAQRAVAGRREAAA